jgi:hypothetical protein
LLDDSHGEMVRRRRERDKPEIWVENLREHRCGRKERNDVVMGHCKRLGDVLHYDHSRRGVQLDVRLKGGSRRTGKSELNRELEKDRRLCKLKMVIQMDEGIEWKEREIAARLRGCIAM